MRKNKPNKKYQSKNHSKFILTYHLIFVCKYRKRLLEDKVMSDDVKQFSYEICQKHNIIIRKMEMDRDHIHYMLETEPDINLSDLVRMLKSYTSYHMWNSHKKLFV